MATPKTDLQKVTERITSSPEFKTEKATPITEAELKKYCAEIMKVGKK